MIKLHKTAQGQSDKQMQLCVVLDTPSEGGLEEMRQLGGQRMDNLHKRQQKYASLCLALIKEAAIQDEQQLNQLIRN